MTMLGLISVYISRRTASGFTGLKFAMVMHGTQSSAGFTSVFARRDWCAHPICEIVELDSTTFSWSPTLCFLLLAPS